MAEKLTKHQQMAVENRGGKLLISAAAGSGKTKVLVDRLISYLLDPVDPANLDDFLIITYTKAAAAELRSKIAAKLTQLIAQSPENRHLSRQMQRLYLTKISTVHSFCGDILREYAYSLDISADFRVADESECAQLQLQVLEKVLDEAYEAAADDPDFCAFVDTQGLGRDDRQIPQIVLSVYQSSRCHMAPDEWLQWCCDSADTDGLSDASETVWGGFLLDDLRSALDLYIDSLEHCAKLAADAQNMEKPADLLAATVSQLRFLRAAGTWDEVLQRKNIDYGRLVFSKKCTDVELVERIKAVRTACKDNLEKKLSAFADPSAAVLKDLRVCSAAARGLISLTKRFSTEYEKRKRSRRVLDFGDLEHRMLDLLLGKKRTGTTAIAIELSKRYREIMVDEYQDSNAVQDAIFEALTQKRNNCFMVGDVKQSIYQFRLADPEIFVDKYNAYSQAETAEPGQGRKVLLSDNFRSSGGVISAVNDVFSVCMSEKVGGLHYGPAEQLNEGIPHISINEPEVELYGISVRDDTYAEEAAFVAARIHELIDGTHMVRQGDTLRPITADDIVILLRSPGSVGSEFVHALEHRGIRCATGGSVDLLQTEEISVLRSLLQIISNPLQDIPLLAVLSSRIIGFSADDLAALRGIDRYCSIYEVLSKSEDAKAKDFLNMLSALRADARLYTLSELLQRLFRTTRMDSIYAAMPDGETRTANLQLFCQLAGDFEATAQRDLTQFLEHLDALEEKGLVVGGQPQQQGAVTLMSIHKSKGLEFPVVFLCGLSRRFNQENARAQVLCHKELGLGLNCVDTKNRVRYPTIAKRAIAAKIVADGISEELRVLYVAMTRPKDRLIMTYAVGNLESSIQDIALRLDICDPLLMTSDVSCPGDWILQTALRRTEAGEFFKFGTKPDCVSVHANEWHIRVVEAPMQNNTSVPLPLESHSLPEELLRRIREGLDFEYAYKASMLTPSKQTATQLKGRSKDQEVAQDSPQYQPHTFRSAAFAEPIEHATEFGNAMHSVMQYIDFKQCADVSGVRSEIQRLVREQYISEEYGALANAQMIVALFSSDIGKILRTDVELLREFKFSVLVDAQKYSGGEASDEILLQGVVDCAIIEPDGITVIDFKTDSVTDETVKEKTDFYSGQIQVYADALSRIFSRPVKASWLYFFRLNRFVEVKV